MRAVAERENSPTPPPLHHVQQRSLDNAVRHRCLMQLEYGLKVLGLLLPQNPPLQRVLRLP